MNALAHSLPLPEIPVPVIAPTEALVVPPITSPQSRRTRKQTWLAMHFADWPLHVALHALTREQCASLTRQPVAVLDQDRQRRVLAVNALALAQGVRPGHTLNASLALCAQLQLLPRDTAAETRLLVELAAWAQRYTSLVSIEAPNELLLEVRGSLRLFGGIAALLKDIEHALQQRQLVASVAISPTASAALCLARCHHNGVDKKAAVVTPKQLKTTLSALPIGALRWPMDIEVRLARFGVVRLDELWRLPRADLARRIGVRYLRELDALLGRQVELRKPFKAMPIYRDRVILDFDISSTSLLEQVLLSALQRLQKYLREHDLALGRVYIELRHRERQATRLCIGLATPTAEMSRVAALLHERLNCLVLPAPALEIRLCVKQLLAAQGTAADLLSGVTHTRPAQAQTEMLGRLLEKLQVRLGKNAIQGLQVHADHRPECAQVMRLASLQASGTREGLTGSAVRVEPVETHLQCFSEKPFDGLRVNGICKRSSGIQLPMAHPVRPLWLLPEPVALCEGIKPPHDLHLLQGPERIEAGWWNGALVRRDYYVAINRNRSRCWVFKDLLQPSGWYVHGWFG